jgi:serine/threonine protein kinase
VQDVQITLPIGSTLQDRYIVEELLGKGGFGAVYRVRDLRVKGNLFALKEVIDTDKKERERFRFECEVLRRLDHPALPRVYHTFEDDKRNRAYMVMDYINGSNLEVLRKQQPHKRFSFAQVMGIMASVVNAVSYLHQQDPPIIHRDIKPSNIICPEDSGEAVLVDLGIAKEYDMDATTTAVRRCSPGYGAPEQYARGTNPQTDIYGLAATFYALLTGEVPTDAFHRLALLGGKHIDPLVPVHQLAPDTPQYVSAVIQRAMAIQSKDRFASVEEFWQALHAQPVEPVPIPVGKVPAASASASAPAAAIPTSATAPTVIIRRQSGDPRSRRKVALALLFAALALLALSAGLIFGNGILSTASPVKQPAATATVKSTPKPTTSVPTVQPGITPTVPAVIPTRMGATPTVPPATPTRSSTSTAPAATPTPTVQPTVSPTSETNR